MKTFVVYENGSFVCLAYAETVQGLPLTKATTESIEIKVIDTTTKEQVGDTITLTGGDLNGVVFDTAQTDIRWTEDTTGYNIAPIISGEYVPEGNRFYDVQAYVTPTDGYAFPIIWRVQTENTYH